MRSRWLEAGVGLAAAAWIALAIAGCTFTPGVAPDMTEVDGGSLPNSYACSCTCKFKAQSPTLTVLRSSDDAEEDSNTLTDVLTNPVLRIGEATDPLLTGLRFQNVPVPTGVVVQSAFVQFTAGGSNANAADFTWVGEASDSATTFTNGPGNLNNRPPTTNTVAWPAVPAWVAGEAGAAERSPDLSPIINEIVSRPGWALGNALALGIYGTGLRRAVAFDGNPAQAAQLVLTFTVPGSPVTTTLQVCMPDAINPSLTDGGEPNGNQLKDDCQNRVADTLSGLDQACNFPSDCSCDIPTVFTPHFAEACSTLCTPNPLDPTTCATFDPASGRPTATNAPGDEPVCTVEVPLSAELYGQRSLARVSGQISFHNDDESKTTTTDGDLELEGTPCPGGSCAVGMSYLLEAAPLHFESLFGSATFRNLAAVGATTPGNEAILASDGTGAFASEASRSAGRGTRGSDEMALVGTNGDPIALAVDWSGKTLSLSGTLVGSVDPELKRCENAGPSANQICTQDSDCGEDDSCSGDDGACRCIIVGPTDTSMALTLTGTLVNQPPAVVAGADQVVECNAAGAGRFTLSATGSDPDGNAHLFTWLLGGRTGTPVGYAQSVAVSQAVGTTQGYQVQLIDSKMQAAYDDTQVQVVDTTPPVIACNADATIGPSSHPVSFRATASDVCDPAATPVLTAFRCFKINGSGKELDMTHACDATLSGDTITISHTNGMGEHVQWTAQVTDASGNSSTTTCETVVGKH